MKVTGLRQTIRFKLKTMVADYIKFNTTQRTDARKDKCKRNFFELTNVAPYGKTMENVVKFTNIKVLTDMEKSRRLAEKPQCINSRLFNPNLVAVESRKINQVINKPFQIWFAVLKYSKLHMHLTYLTQKD